MKERLSQNTDMQKMQQEAIRRVREMQARAKCTLEKANIECKKSTSPNNQSVNEKIKSQNQPPNPQKTSNAQQDSQNHQPSPQKKISPSTHNSNHNNNSSRNISSNPNNILSLLAKDQEKLLILILILILTEDPDSMGIVLALATLII